MNNPLFAKIRAPKTPPIAERAYKIIATHMTNYEIIYGGLANLALLMVWLYFVSFIFVIGLALNYGDEIEENK